MNQRWPRCRTGNNATADAPSPATLRVCDLERSEALRARQARWRAVFDSPSPAARFPASRLRRRVVLRARLDLLRQHTGIRGRQRGAASSESSSAAAELQQVLLATDDILVTRPAR